MILYFALILTVPKIINSSQQHYCIEKLRWFRPIVKKGNNSFVMKACNQFVGKPVVSEWHRVREVAQLIVSVSEASCHWTTTLQHSPGTGQSSCLHPLSLCLPRHKQSFNRTSLKIHFLCCWLIKYSVINKSTRRGGGMNYSRWDLVPEPWNDEHRYWSPKDVLSDFSKLYLNFVYSVRTPLSQLLTHFFHTLVNIPFWNNFIRFVGQNNQNTFTSLLREISFPKFVFWGHKVKEKLVG